jgi:hypothetical protein
VTAASLASRRHSAQDDVRGFTAFAMEKGWGDGLPLVPPTEEIVVEYLGATARPPEQSLGPLAPALVDCTVEMVAINAAMAGAPPESMPLLCAAIEALADPQFDLAAVNATTASVCPILILNGPVRLHLDIPTGGGCFGGVAGPAPAIGRALRLVMRNVAGQVIGLTSASMYGQPARVVGIVAGEWEEESPWAPLAERRGVPGSAVTVFGSMGTMNIVDNVAHQNADILIEIIAKSVAYPGANGFPTQQARTEALIALNPIWAGIIAGKYPSIEETTERFWRALTHPLDRWPEAYRGPLQAAGRVNEFGEVPLVPSPDDLMIMVCGSKGNLHSQGFHGCVPNFAITRPVSD